jgi:hypothetical protein
MLTGSIIGQNPVFISFTDAFENIGCKVIFTIVVVHMLIFCSDIVLILVRSRKTEDGSRETEVGRPETEDESRETEVGRRKVK